MAIVMQVERLALLLTDGDVQLAHNCTGNFVLEMLNYPISSAVNINTSCSCRLSDNVSPHQQQKHQQQQQFDSLPLISFIIVCVWICPKMVEIVSLIWFMRHLCSLISFKLSENQHWSCSNCKKRNGLETSHCVKVKLGWMQKHRDCYHRRTGLIVFLSCSFAKNLKLFDSFDLGQEHDCRLQHESDLYRQLICSLRHHCNVLIVSCEC